MRFFGVFGREKTHEGYPCRRDHSEHDFGSHLSDRSLTSVAESFFITLAFSTQAPREKSRKSNFQIRSAVAAPSNGTRDGARVLFLRARNAWNARFLLSTVRQHAENMEVSPANERRIRACYLIPSFLPKQSHERACLGWTARLRRRCSGVAGRTSSSGSRWSSFRNSDNQGGQLSRGEGVFR